MASLGMIYQPTFAPERLPQVAVAAEAAGIPELWVFEDCFKQSGLASLVSAIAATNALRVGVGVLPMPLRNVALLAMELATIERTYPGRARFGVGHGVLDWMGQAGDRVASPLTLMREYVPALRTLLAGQELTVDGRYVHLDGVRLDWPPAGPVPILAAGEGPKTVALAGEVADGIVISTGYSPAMVRSLVDVATAAREGAGVHDPFEVVAFCMVDFGDGAAGRMEAEFDEWRLEGERRFAATGSDDEIEATVRAFFDAGASTLLLQSGSHIEDLDAYVAGVARIAERVAGL